MARILYFGKLSSIYGELSETAELPASVADTAGAFRGLPAEGASADGELGADHPALFLASIV